MTVFGVIFLAVIIVFLMIVSIDRFFEYFPKRKLAKRYFASSIFYAILCSACAISLFNYNMLSRMIFE